MFCFASRYLRQIQQNVKKSQRLVINDCSYHDRGAKGGSKEQGDLKKGKHVRIFVFFATLAFCGRGTKVDF